MLLQFNTKSKTQCLRAQSVTSSPFDRFDIIMHPVMHRLIAVKWKIYGKTGAILDLVLNLIYTILWTVESVTIPKNGDELYTPLRENIWRLAMNGFIILFTLMEIKRQVIREFTGYVVLVETHRYS